MPGLHPGVRMVETLVGLCVRKEERKHTCWSKCRSVSGFSPDKPVKRQPEGGSVCLGAQCGGYRVAWWEVMEAGWWGWSHASPVRKVESTGKRVLR